MYSCMYCFTATVTRHCPTCKGILGLCDRCIPEVGHDYCPRCDSPHDHLADPVATIPVTLEDVPAAPAPA